MLTSSTVFSLLVIISNCLESALCQTCLREDVDRNCLQDNDDAERSSAQDQDGDLVSFLQAGGSHQLTFAAGVKGSRQETLTGPSAKSSSAGSHRAPAPTEPPMIFALTKFADHCEMFARDVFGAGYEWVLPVIIVVMVLIAVGFYSFVIMRDEQRPDVTFRARPFSNQLPEENFPTIVPESFPTIPPVNFPSVPPADAPVIIDEPRRSAYGTLSDRTDERPSCETVDVPIIIEEHRRIPAVDELPSVSMQQQQEQRFPKTWATPSATAPLRSPSQTEKSPSKEGTKSKSINDLPATASLILSRPDNGVPPLCPTLVLPSFESQFAINIEDMERAETGSELSVCGFDSKPLLKLKINESESGTRLDIYVDNASRTGDKLPVDAKPRCSIIAPQDDIRPFVIRGPGDKHYGTFHTVAGKSTQFEIVVDGRPIVVIEGETSSMQLDAFTPDPHNHPVAMAAKNIKDYKGGEPCFEIRVLPGYDAMLIIAVVMSIMLFIDHD